MLRSGPRSILPPLPDLRRTSEHVWSVLEKPTQFSAIAEFLKQNTQNYYRVFTEACNAARLADDKVDRADFVAKRIRQLLAPKLSKAKPPTHGRKRVLIVDRALAGELGECGVVSWDSGNEYTGQMRNRIESGFGILHIYALGRSRNPNDMAFFKGEIDAGRFGPYGAYTFVDGAEFKGEWVEGRPKFGVKAFFHRDDPDYYFGGFGTFDNGLWKPNGHGVAVHLRGRRIICGIFREGEPDVLYSQALAFDP